MNFRNYNILRLYGKLFHKKELLLICDEKLTDHLTPSWEKNLFRFITEWISDSPVLRIRTSGSTGDPKWISVEKDKMVTSALATGRFFDLHENDTALLCLPVDYIAGKMMVVRAFVLGLNLFPAEPEGISLQKTEFVSDFAAMTPMQVNNILEKPIGSAFLNKIEKLIIGGAEINPKLMDKIKQLKNKVFQTYGMTETLTHVALRKINLPGEPENYKALPGIKFSLDDRNCLVISAPDLQQSVFITNDIAELVNETEFKFKGRFDNVINSGGIKLSPEEIESKLNPFLSHRFIVAGISDEKLGQKLILVIEGRESDPVSLPDLAVRANLAKFETPKLVIYTGSFPTTENGKIIRPAIIKNLID